MEHINPLVFSIGIIIFIAHLFTTMFEKTKIPDVLLLIIIGIIIGPQVLNLLKPIDFGYVGPLLSTIALILMLFEGGNHLSLSNLKESLRDCIPITFGTFFLTFIVSFLVLFLIKTHDLFSSLYAAAILGSISPAVVVPFLSLLKISTRTRSMLFVESALTDVLSIVMALTLMESFLNGEGSIVGFIGKIISSLSLATLFGLIGAVLWSTVLEKIRKFPNTIFTSLAFLFVLYGLTESMHFSGPITILVFGIILANAEKIPINIVRRFGTNKLTGFNLTEKSFFSEIIFLVKTFFFIYLGLSIQFGNWKILIFSFILTTAIYFGRILICLIFLPKNTFRKEAILASAAIPKGLAAAVLAELPFFRPFPNETHIILEDVRAIIYCVIFFSIIFTATTVFFLEKDLFNEKILRIYKRFNPITILK